MIADNTDDTWFQRPLRRSVIAGEAMIAAATPQAALAGYDVLRAGGNAMDAAIAAIATTSVVEASQCGLGGDCFALIAKPGQKPRAYNGSGRAPMGLAVDRLLGCGIAVIERTSPHAVTVPGAVEAWCRLHRDFGSMDLQRLFAPAIDYAERGYVVQRRVALDWGRSESALRAHANAAAVYLPGGRAPRAGERHRIPGLADLFRAIVRRGADGFYRGQAAADIVAYLRGLGGYHEIDDFERHVGEYVEPISTTFHGYTAYQCPPNGQGLAALVLMNLLERSLGAATLESVEGIHLLAEASKIAFSIRDGVIADPAQTAVLVADWLSPEMTDKLAAQIDRARAAPSRSLESIVPDHPDTSYVTVVDRDGLAVSLISSIFSDFGSLLVEPRSGLLLQNRGMGFRVAPGHPNCVAPGKRPLHTIIPGILMKGDRVALSFGVVGGHYQPVGHAQLLHSILAEGLDVQEALNRPRSLCLNGTLQLETTQPQDRLPALQALGHLVVPPPHPLGGGHGVWIDHQRGVLIGGSDTRRDGIVAGY